MPSRSAPAFDTDEIDECLCGPPLEEITIGAVPLGKQWFFSRWICSPVLEGVNDFSNRLKDSYRFRIYLFTENIVVRGTKDIRFQTSNRKLLRLTSLPAESADRYGAGRP